MQFVVGELLCLKFLLYVQNEQHLNSPEYRQSELQHSALHQPLALLFLHCHIDLLPHLAGNSDIVSPDLWATAAAQVPMRPQQLQRLEASWLLFERAMERLNQERQQLRLQLQHAIDSPALAAAAAAGRRHDSAGTSAAAAAAATDGRHTQDVGTSAAAAAAAAAAGGACAAAQGMAGCCLAAAADVPGCFGVQRLCCGCMDLQDYEQLADDVERNLMRGRAMIMAFGESVG
jgi:hypothetical protein